MSLEHPSGKIFVNKPKKSILQLFRTNKLYKILIIAGAVVFLLAPAGYFGYKYYKSKNQKKAATVTKQEAKDERHTEPMPEMPRNRTIDELKAAEKTASKEEKLGIYANMTALYAQKKDYKAALETNEKLRAIDPDGAGKMNYQTALLYEMSGNKPKAIEYYRAELNRVKNMSDEDYQKESVYSRQSRISEMEDTIKRLGGTL